MLKSCITGELIFHGGKFNVTPDCVSQWPAQRQWLLLAGVQEHHDVVCFYASFMDQSGPHVIYSSWDNLSPDPN